MLTYLINVTDDMLALSLLTGMVLAFLDTFCRSSGRLIGRLGLLAGFIAAAVRAYFTNTRRIKDGWKVGTYGYGFSLGFLVLTLILLAVFAYFLMRKKEKSKMKTAASWVISLSFALLMTAFLYCSLPNVLVYPFKFDTGGNGIISSEFFLRLVRLWRLQALYVFGAEGYKSRTVCCNVHRPCSLWSILLRKAYGGPYYKKDH